MSKKQTTLSEKELAIVGQYVNNLSDLTNMSKLARDYEGLIDLYHENPVPLHTEEQINLFKSLETYKASNEKDLKMITTIEKKPYKVKMDYAEHIDKKWSIKQEMEEKGIELEGNFKAPLHFFMDEDITELIGGGPVLKLVNIEDTKITRIPAQFFYGKTTLTEIRMPDTLTVIEHAAFFGCRELKKVILSKALIKIENSAFESCKKLEEIKIPDSVRVIDYGAFCNCTSLKNLTLSNNLVSLDSRAFADCSSLTYVSVPTSVSSLGERCFQECGLVIVDFNPSIQVIPKSTFESCSNLMTITIPTSITSIGMNCFKDCRNLRRVINLENVKFSQQAFLGCSSLQEPYRYIVDRIDVLDNGQVAVNVIDLRHNQNGNLVPGGVNVVRTDIGTMNCYVSSMWHSGY